MLRFKTIGHYAIAFGESRYDIEEMASQIDVPIFYQGEIEKLSRAKATKIAELHHNCLEYWEMAMMPLFKGYRGNYKSGTENPVDAIESLKTPKQSEIDMPYIIIWNLFGSVK